VHRSKAWNSPGKRDRQAAPARWRPRIAGSLVAIALLAAALPAPAAESYDNCTGIVDSLPATIGTSGTWCLQGDLSTAMGTGAAVSVTANNVTLDCNGFKIGGLAAGPGSAATGVFANGRTNTVVRNCSIRGFQHGIDLFLGEGHVVEDNSLDGSTSIGIQISGDGVIRRNIVRGTGGSTLTPSVNGIRTTHDVDIIDNSIIGVAAGSGGGAYGILAYGNENGSIRDNRIRGVVGEGLVVGISSAQMLINGVPTEGRITLANNQIIGPGDWALFCHNGSGVARDNVLSGFTAGITNCTVSIGNDVTP